MCDGVIRGPFTSVADEISQTIIKDLKSRLSCDDSTGLAPLNFVELQDQWEGKIQNIIDGHMHSSDIA